MTGGAVGLNLENDEVPRDSHGWEVVWLGSDALSALTADSSSACIMEDVVQH